MYVSLFISSKFKDCILSSVQITKDNFFKFKITAFPVFTKQPTNVTVRTSDRVRLDCAVDGDPKPQIYWQFNFGNDFPAARERRMRLVDNYESIIIDNATPSDRGVYTCTAENSAGIIRTNVTVEISKLNHFTCSLNFEC